MHEERKAVCPKCRQPGEKPYEIGGVKLSKCCGEVVGIRPSFRGNNRLVESLHTIRNRR